MCSKLPTGVGPLSKMTPLNTIFYFILKIKKMKKYRHYYVQFSIMAQLKFVW